MFMEIIGLLRFQGLNHLAVAFIGPLVHALHPGIHPFKQRSRLGLHFSKDSGHPCFPLLTSHTIRRVARPLKTLDRAIAKLTMPAALANAVKSSQKDIWTPLSAL